MHSLLTGWFSESVGTGLSSQSWHMNSQREHAPGRTCNRLSPEEQFITKKDTRTVDPLMKSIRSTRIWLFIRWRKKEKSGRKGGGSRDSRPRGLVDTKPSNRPTQNVNRRSDWEFTRRVTVRPTDVNDYSSVCWSLSLVKFLRTSFCQFLFSEPIFYLQVIQN